MSLDRDRSLPTVLFAGHPAFELHTPSQSPWARTLFIPVKTGWGPAIEEIGQIVPDVCICFNPDALTSSQVKQVPGLKIGVLAREYNADQLRQLAQLSLQDGFRWFTAPEPATKAREVLPILQTLPPLVDVARLPRSPDFSAQTAVMLESKDPHQPELVGLELLREKEDVQAILQALKRSGVVLCPSGADEYPQLLALALGELVVRDRELPRHWGFEAEDEYLVRPRADWTKTLAELERAPGRFRAVRIRAWQKVREMFDASSVMQRMVHDARWLAATPAGAPNSTEEPRK